MTIVHGVRLRAAAAAGLLAILAGCGAAMSAPPTAGAGGPEARPGPGVAPPAGTTGGVASGPGDMPLGGTGEPWEQPIDDAVPDAGGGPGPGLQAEAEGGEGGWAAGSLTEATVFGGLTRGDVRDAMRGGRGSVRRCYEQALVEGADLGGRVTVRFFVNPDGSVQRAETTENTTGSETLARCLVDAVRRIGFPRADGVTGVTYPFHVDFADGGD
jgi:TonB family protein